MYPSPDSMDGIAHRQTADLRGCSDVPFEQRRRDFQRVGDVVESFARIISRQQRGNVYVEGEQIANRIRVFGAVEAVQSDGARVRMLGCVSDPTNSRHGSRNASMTLRSGRGMPLGGIIPARNLRTTFSQVSGLRETCDGIHLLQRQASGFQLVVVADLAILGHEPLIEGHGGSARQPEGLHTAQGPPARMKRDMFIGRWPRALPRRHLSS